MVRFLFLCVGLLTSVLASGKYVTFLTPDSIPVPDVNCVGFSEKGDSIDSWVSDKKGIIDIRKADSIYYLVASHSQFSDRMIYNNTLNEDNNITVLSPGVALKEVVVTPSDVQEFADHTSYRLSLEDMSKYANVLQSLNEIPNLTVLSNGAVFFEGSSDIKLLIDGVDATIQELQSISKEDIATVDVYQTPPIRFMSQGITAVVDVRLKSKIHGGNGALNISQAFQSFKGDNSAAFYYNYKQSRFSLLYNNSNTHYKKFRQSEVLDYEFDGVHYNKTKEGLDSKYDLDDNNLNFSYQVNQPKNFLYNVKAGVAFNQYGKNAAQNVTTPTESFLATNQLQTDYTKYIVGNYFEKNFGDNAGTLMANVNYQHYSNSYKSAYNEESESEIAVNNSESDYKTHLDAILSEIQYQFPESKLGRFAVRAYETYKHSKYVDTTNPFYQTSNALGGMVQWMGWKGPISWFVFMGVDWYRTASATLSKAHDLCIPTPSVYFNWRPSKSVQLSVEYSYSGNGPSIAQLSETDQWLDTKLVYHGNSNLKPYATHSVGLRFVWNNKYVNLSMQNTFNSSNGMICDMYTQTDKYMLQTMVNLTNYQELGSRINLAIKPLGNNKLVFWNRVNLAYIRGKNPEYSWNGYRFQWMSSLSLNLKHWTAELFYQYPGKIVEGQLERPRAQAWYATVLYRPITNLSVGVQWFMPFGNGMKEGERTVNNAPVYADTEYVIMDFNNLISIKLSYNFSFGRNKNKARPEFDNYDNDSGILRK